MKIFSDPKNVFKINLPSKWEKETDSKENFFQFKVSKNCTFSIGYELVDEEIKKFIHDNNIGSHDFNLPNISFTENFEVNNFLQRYSWFTQLKNHFFFASYVYDSKIKRPKDVGLELMDIRIGLHYMQYMKNEKSVKSTPKKSASSKKNYSDIINWREKPLKFFNFFTKSDKSNSKIVYIEDIDIPKLYGLLKSQISHKPNGFHDLLGERQPLDRMIWWDFILECDKGFIQVTRTQYILQVIYEYDGPFDVKQFFEDNINKYKEVITKEISLFEKHMIYINHYKSYDECVEALAKEIFRINLTPPKLPTVHHGKKLKEGEFTNNVGEFIANSVKYHALAKSLVLNAAFKIESFLNLIIRIGQNEEFKNYPEVLDKFLRQDFTHKLKNIRFCSQILIDNFDISKDTYRNTKELINLRNKYVHYDEDNLHNKLGEVYYDDNYPLHQIPKSRPIIDATIRSYHHPNINMVKKAISTSNNFVREIYSLVNPKLKGSLSFLVEQNPIGYNEKTGNYSVVYNPRVVDFYGFAD